MSRTQPLIAEDILDAYPVRRHRCLLDVGGGDGAFLMAAADRASALRLLLFDLPPSPHKARGALPPRGWLTGQKRSAEISGLTRSRAGRMSSPSSASSTTMTTPRCSRCCAPFGSLCRPTACC